ncbi:hypothetical protein KY314_00560, partial [Candidatus Woesearchaeota archaeon]|nr:hypothetical protein [Candidatus Woesearchaeota archaeon]
MSLKEVFILLENLGFVNVVIPFVIIFIVLYSVLNKVKIFKDNKVNSVIACLISFIAIAAADIVKSVNLFSYYIVMALFSAVVIFMFIALAGGKINLKSDKYKKYVSFVVAFLLCLVVFYAVYMVIGPKIDIGPLSFFMFSRFVPILVAVAVFVLIIWYVQSGSSDDSKD